MIKVIEAARNFPRELEEMRCARDFWRWGFWFLAVCCVVLALIAR